MADLLQFDEINRIEKNELPAGRAVPVEKYFEPMGITREQKDRRISFASGLMDRMIYLFALAQVYGRYGQFSIYWFSNEIYNEYLSFATMFFGADKIDDVFRRHIRNLADIIAENTAPYIDTPDEVFKPPDGNNKDPSDKPKGPYPPAWYTSPDRSEYIGENEAIFAVGYDEFEDAMAEGYTEKTWNTVRDNRVRDAHADAEGQTVGIEEYFIIGDEFGMYPGDTDNMGPENTVGCRCWLTYS